MGTLVLLTSHEEYMSCNGPHFGICSHLQIYGADFLDVIFLGDASLSNAEYYYIFFQLWWLVPGDLGSIW